MKKRTYDDDDGRRIADMTGVGAPSSLFTFRRPPDRDPKKRERREADAAQETSDRNAAPTMNRDERFAAVGGALADAPQTPARRSACLHCGLGCDDLASALCVAMKRSVHVPTVLRFDFAVLRHHRIIRAWHSRHLKVKR